MIGLLENDGWSIISSPEEADILLVNTCGFIQPAVEEGIEEILDLAKYKNISDTKIPVGVVPLGTGNAFARDLNLDNTHWQDAVEIIARNNLRKVDVGKFHTHGQDYYFLNILGMGFVFKAKPDAFASSSCADKVV